MPPVVAAIAAVKAFFVVHTVLAFFAKIAATILLGTLTSKLFGPKAGRTGSFAGIQTTTRGALEPRRIVYGRAKVGGVISYNNVRGSSNSTLSFEVCYTDHFAEAVTFFLDDREIPIADISWTPPTTDATAGSGSGSVSTSEFQGNGAPGLTITWYPGFDDQPANAQKVAHYSDLTTAHQLRGIFNVWFSLFYTEVLADVWKAGPPRTFTVVMDGRRVYDPRLDDTNGGSGDHRYADPDTWEFSDNVALCISDYLFVYMDADPAQDIDWPSVATAADACDVVVDIPGTPSTEKRFTCNGAFFTDENHEAILTQLKEAMAGRLLWTGGEWTMYAGVYAAPPASDPIDLTWLAGDLTVRGTAPQAERFNTVEGFYVDPERDYKTVEFNSAINASYVTRDAGLDLPFDQSFRFTNSEYMCQRIAIRKLDQFDNQVIVDVDLNEKGAKIEAGKFYEVTLDEYTWTDKVFRCVGWEPTPNGNYKVSLKEDFSTRYTDPTVGEYTTRTTAGVVVPPSEVVPPPTSLTATGLAGIIELNWENPPESLFDKIQIWRSTTDDIGTASKIAVQTGDVYLDAVNDTTEYFYWIRARFRGRNSVYEPVTTAGISGTATSSTGPPGDDGISVFIAQVYTRSASAPSTPDVDDGEYNFTTLTLTPPSIAGGSAENWFVTPPAGTDALYVSHGTFDIIGQTGIDTDVTWSSPDLLVEHGDPGTSVFVGQVYLRKATAPTEPVTNDGSYNFGTNVLVPPSTGGGSDDDWSITVPAGPGDPVYLSVGTFEVIGPTDTDNTVDWSAPVILASDGADGADGSDGDAGLSVFVAQVFIRSASAPSTPSADDGQYNFTTQVLTPPASWSVTPPAGDDPLYISTGSFSIVGQTGTDTDVIWTAPALLVEDGNSVFVGQVFLRKATAPTEPVTDDGSYNFGTNVLTPPSTAASDIAFIGAEEAQANASSLVIDIHSSTIEDDIVFLFAITADGDDGGFDAITDWTEIIDAATFLVGGSPSSPPGMSVFWRKMPASPPANVTIVPTFGATEISGQTFTFRGQDLTTPIDVTSTTTNGNSTNPNPPSIGSGSSTDKYLTLAACMLDGTASITAVPSGYTDPGGIGQIATGRSTGRVAYRNSVIDPAAAENPGVFTAATEQWGACTIAIRPAAGGTSADDWSVTVPAGTDDLYVSVGTFEISGTTNIDETVDWSAPVVLASDGADGGTGAAGDDGLSVHVAQVFQRSASAPSTPSVDDGQYNFTSQVLTPPSGWSVEPPAGSDPLYVSTGSFSIVGQTGTDTTVTWTAPDILVQDGADGAGGAAGDDGLSVHVAQVFQRSASAPSTPSVDDGQYNFTTQVLTPPSGWSVAPPAGTDPLYVSTGSFSIVGQTGTDTTVTWTSPDILVQDGADGADGAEGNSVFVGQVFLRKASAPTEPIDDDGSYNFATNVLTPPSTGGGSDDDWSITVPAGTDDLYISTGSFEVSDATQTDNTVDWSAPVILASDGADGATGGDGDDGLSVHVAQVFQRSASAPSTPTADDGQYNFTTQVLTPPSGWSVEPPAGSDPLYVSTGSFSIVGQTGTDTTVTWTSPDILVQDGADGATGGDGDDGLSVHVAQVFQRSASAPSTPTADDGQYNFTTQVLTPPSGWSVEPPAGSDPLYVSTGSFSIVGPTGTDTTVTWTSPDILVQDGADGAAGAEGNSVFVGQVFLRKATAPTEPIDDDGSYNFATNVLTPPSTGGGSADNWSITVPAGTDPLYVSSGSFEVSDATQTDNTVDWTAPIILASDGADGADGDDGADGAEGLSVFVGTVFLRKATAPTEPINDDGSYNFNTNVLTPPSTGGGSADNWSITVPAGSDPLYISSGSFEVTDATATDNTVDWTAPVILAIDGSDGSQGDAGDDGLSVFVASVYRRASSAPATPSVDDGSYNFTTQTLTPPSSWFVEPPAGSDPLWISSGSFSIIGQTGTDNDVTWTAPDLLVQDGSSIHVALVYLRKATAPTEPIDDDGQYNFTTLTLTPPSITGGSAEDWFVNPPAGTDPAYVSAGTFEIPGPTGTDTTVDWSAPILLVSDGAQGAAGRDGIVVGGVKINTSTFAGADGSDPGEMYVHGLDNDGLPDDVDGALLYNGVVEALPKGIVYTSQTSSQGFLVLDLGVTGFTIPTQSNAFIVAARIITTDGVASWEYDNNAAFVTLTPTADMLVIGSYEVKSAEDIFQAVLGGAISLSTLIISAARIETAQLSAISATIGLLETRAVGGSPTTPRLVLSDTDSPLQIFADDDSTLLFSLTESDGELELYLLGEFSSGSIDSGAMFSAAGIEDLRGRLGITIPLNPTGGNLTIPGSRAVATTLVNTRLDDPSPGEIAHGVDDITLKFTFSDHFVGDNPQATAGEWTIHWEVNIDSGGWNDVATATYNIVGVVYDVEGLGPDDWIHALNVTKTFIYTPAGADDNKVFEFRVVSIKTAGDSNNPTYFSASANEPIFGDAAGNVSNVATPLINQIAVWTDIEHIKGDPNFTYNGSLLRLLAGDARFNDNVEMQFGNLAGGDARIFFNATDLIIEMIDGVDFRLKGGAALDNMIVCIQDGACNFYYNNTNELRTQLHTASDNITGAEVKHFSGTFWDVGMANMPDINKSGALTVSQTHAHRTIRITNVSGTITFANDATMKNDSVGWIINTTTSNQVLGATSNNLEVFSGDGVANNTGNMTLAGKGWCTWYKLSDTEYFLVGVGLS